MCKKSRIMPDVIERHPRIAERWTILLGVIHFIPESLRVAPPPPPEVTVIAVDDTRCGGRATIPFCITATLPQTSRCNKG